RQIKVLSTSSNNLLNNAVTSDLGTYKIVNKSTQIYSSERDVLEAVQDGEITSEEIESFAMLEKFSYNDEEHQEIKPPSELNADFDENQAPVLYAMVNQIESGQPLEINDMFSASIGMLISVESDPDPQILQHGLLSHKEVSSAVQEGTKNTKESIIEGDWGIDTKITSTEKTSKHLFTTRDASIKHIEMSSSSMGTGLLSDRTFESETEKLTFIEIYRNTTTTLTSNPVTTRSKTIFGKDTKILTGQDTKSDSTKLSGNKTWTNTVYFAYNQDIDEIKTAISDTHLNQREIDDLSVILVNTQDGEEILEDQFDDSTKYSEYKQGMIRFAPMMGGLTNLAMKNSFGYDIEAMDVADVAIDTALTLVSGGSSSIVRRGFKSAGSAVVKGSIKGAGKILAKTTGTAITNSAKNALTDSKELIGAGQRAVQYFASRGARESSKELVQQVAGRAKMAYNKVTGINHFDLSKLNTRDFMHGIIGRRKIINSNYAGKTMRFNDPVLARRYPDGVKFDKSGYPDFSPYAKNKVTVPNLDGKIGSNADFVKANKAANLDKTPDNFTWHHHQNGRDMYLVPTDLHKAVDHSGGASLLRDQNIFFDRTLRNFSRGSFLVLNFAKPDDTSQIPTETLND
ncbi:MAG: HNH endonuclease, partial [Deltaproteobacteria bacterium]|nr:HNH endonuclease [Deltaproteobacteria bacterium]